MAKWIGKGVLKVGRNKFIEYGEDIPESFPKNRVTQLKAQGLIGDIAAIVKATPFDVDNSELEASHRDLMKAHEELEIKHSALITFNEGLEASHRELMKDCEVLQETNKALTDESLKIIADKDFVVSAFEYVQGLIDQIKKTEPNREIRKILNMEG